MHFASIDFHELIIFIFSAGINRMASFFFLFFYLVALHEIMDMSVGQDISEKRVFVRKKRFWFVCE